MEVVKTLLNNCLECKKEYKLIRPKQRKYPYLCRNCASQKQPSIPKTYGERCNGSRSKYYRTWTGIRDRVFTKTNKDYKEGVKLYKPWEDFNTFKQFLMDNNFTEESQLRRIDPNGHYEPNNIKIIHRPLKKYPFRGRNLTPAEIYNLVAPLPIDKSTFRRRLKKGWDINKAMMEPPRVNQFKYKKN